MKSFRRYYNLWRKRVRNLFNGTYRNRWYFRKIKKVFPELESYKTNTFLYFLDRAKSVGCKDLKTYSQYLETHPDEKEYMKTNLTFKGTHFFRGDDWDYFIQECLSHLAARKDLRLWCAGCSSGEEVYSLIMSLLDYVPIEAIHVLATDYNDEVLDRCREGSYFNMHYHEIPKRYQKHVEKGEKKFVMNASLKEAVETRNLNLLTDPYPTGFDVILCRNVLKFFTPQVIEKVQEKLASSLRSGGYLFLSADDDHGFVEFIKNPPILGLHQLDGRCIYQKN